MIQFLPVLENKCVLQRFILSYCITNVKLFESTHFHYAVINAVVVDNFERNVVILWQNIEISAFVIITTVEL